MSIIEILEHDETIYTVLNSPPPDPPKTPRYESKLEKELKKQKIPQTRSTFGYAVTPLRPPEKFLKKGQGIPQLVRTAGPCHTAGNLPPVPKCPPPIKKEDKPQVNFRIENIKKVINARPKTPEPRLVDTRDGHIKKIKGSGEVPEYCKREDFGRMPEYLLKRNKRIQKAKQKVQDKERNRKSLCTMIAEAEREKLLQDLKQNWQVMQKAFLQLPMLTDTPAKVARKSKMEQDLKQLEKDIALVESNPYIYIF